MEHHFNHLQHNSTKGSATPTYESESLRTVKSKHDELNDLISNLRDKLTSVNTHNEREFLAAYRVHMVEIQEELKDLRSQVQKAENALNDDGAVAKLEEEVTWFREETNRLRNHTTSMNRDIENLTSRMSILQEQRDYLSEQLKTVLKRSRILEAELHYNQTLTTQIPQHPTDLSRYDPPSLSNSGILPSSKSLPKLFPTGKSSSSSNSSHHLSFSRRAVPGTGGGGGGGEGRTTGQSLNAQAQEALGNFEAFSKKRIPEELALEEAIQDVLVQEVLSRKMNTLNRKSVRQLPSTGPDTVHRSVGGVSGLGLDKFSEGDRLSAMVRFLANPLVFQRVVQIIQSDLQTPS